MGILPAKPEFGGTCLVGHPTPGKTTPGKMSRVRGRGRGKEFEGRFLTGSELNAPAHQVLDLTHQSSDGCLVFTPEGI